VHAQVHSKEAIDAHLAEAKHRTKVLRALLGLARATGRALILPRLLCYCDYMWKEMLHGRVGGGANATPLAPACKSPADKPLGCRPVPHATSGLVTPSERGRCSQAIRCACPLTAQWITSSTRRGAPLTATDGR